MHDDEADAAASEWGRQVFVTDAQARVLAVILDRGWGELRRDISRIKVALGFLLGTNIVLLYKLLLGG